MKKVTPNMISKALEKNQKKTKNNEVRVSRTHLEDLVLSLKVILLIRIALWKLVDVDPEASDLLSDLKAKWHHCCLCIYFFQWTVWEALC